MIVADKDDWLFDAKKTLYYAQREDWSVIPEAKRNTRQELQAAADAYLNLFKDKSVQVPWGTPCARLEGSAYTGKGQASDSCNVGVPENIDMVERRYVIDPVVGSVAVFLKMGPKQRPDAHVFRIEDGKIRYVHTVTNCGDRRELRLRPAAQDARAQPGLLPEPRSRRGGHRARRSKRPQRGAAELRSVEIGNLQGFLRGARHATISGMIARRLLSALSALTLLTLAALPACAQDTSFDAYLQQVAAKARSEGVSERTIANMLGGMTPNDRVIALDRDNTSGGPSAGFLPLAPYLRDHNTQARIDAGRRAYARPPSARQRGRGALRGARDDRAGRSGATRPATARSRAISTSPALLATLAWEGRRRALFERELIDLLKIADSGVPRSTLVGSWAGAFGNPQFLPSVYLRHAVDGDGDGDKDIWNSEVDTPYSIANYFRGRWLAPRRTVGRARLYPQHRRPRGDPRPAWSPLYARESTFATASG